MNPSKSNSHISDESGGGHMFSLKSSPKSATEIVPPHDMMKAISQLRRDVEFQLEQERNARLSLEQEIQSLRRSIFEKDL
jgi:predicted transposase YbfD/YdcC